MGSGIKVLTCPICGGAIKFTNVKNGIFVCEFCGREQVFSNLYLENRVKLEIAEMHLRAKEFDLSAKIYKQLLKTDEASSNIPEIWWNLLMCEYGIEYVLDARLKKYVAQLYKCNSRPVHSTSNYQKAIEACKKCGNIELEKTYKFLADEIECGRKELEEMIKIDYDIFICVKVSETGEDSVKTNSIKTRDYSDVALPLYYELKERYQKYGKKVFLSEPLKVTECVDDYFIYPALFKAKCLIVISSEPKYLETVWVKSEIDRYQIMIEKNEKEFNSLIFVSASPRLKEKVFKSETVNGREVLFTADPSGYTNKLFKKIDKILDIKDSESDLSKIMKEKEQLEIQLKKERNDAINQAMLMLKNEYADSKKSAVDYTQIYGDFSGNDVTSMDVNVKIRVGKFDDAEKMLKILIDDRKTESHELFWYRLLCKRKCKSSEELINKGERIEDDECYWYAHSLAPDNEQVEYEKVNNAINYFSSKNKGVKVKQTNEQEKSLNNKLSQNLYKEDFDSVFNGRPVFNDESFIKLGSYPRSAQKTELEQIVWRTIKIADSQALCIANKIIDCVSFGKDKNSSLYEHSNVRTWLNTFYETAFSEMEKNVIQSVLRKESMTEEKVFLLTEYEAANFFAEDEDRRAVPTAYAVKNGVRYIYDAIKHKNYAGWWLASKGLIDETVCRVRSSGAIYRVGPIDFNGVGVRPAIVIDSSVLSAINRKRI